MRPNGVIVTSPALDDDLGFTQRIEDLTIEQFIPQASIEAFDVAVLPRAAWFDVSALGTHSGDPVLHRLGHELRAIVGAEMTGHAAQDEEVRQDIDHVDGLELAIDADRQALVGKLIDDVEHAVLAAIMGTILDDVVGPDVIGMLRSQPDT